MDYVSPVNQQKAPHQTNERGKEYKMTVHEITPDGESTEKWAMKEKGFFGSIKQLVCCGRCGELIRKGLNDKRNVRDMFKPSMHYLCDECYDALP